MVAKVKKTQYGGFQFAMGGGLKNGEFLARLGAMPVKAGQVFSRQEITQSNLMSDLEVASPEKAIPTMAIFDMNTREMTYGWKDNLGAGSIPDVTIVAEKAVYAEQRTLGVNPAGISASTSKGPDVVTVAEKAVLGIQKAVDAGASPKA